MRRVADDDDEALGLPIELELPLLLALLFVLVSELMSEVSDEEVLTCGKFMVVA